MRNVEIVCQNLGADRILPRIARGMREHLGWNAVPAPTGTADAVYLSAYFEGQRLRPWPEKVPVLAYFTHREENASESGKVKLFDEMAKRVAGRIVTCDRYAQAVSPWGLTLKAPPPLELKRFTPERRSAPSKGVVAGFSGYTYASQRKGQDLARELLGNPSCAGFTWRASGRGWPVATKMYSWDEMPGFYCSLDLLICTSRVEGIPMPPLEALACGTSVIIPRNVGMLDELPSVPGIERYEAGNAVDLGRAIARWRETRSEVDPLALRDAVSGYGIERWCDVHAQLLELVFEDAVESPILTPKRGRPPKVLQSKPKSDSTRGIYVVAFGPPARATAARLIQSVKVHMPDVPICLCGAEPLGGEDLFVQQPDSDVGARRAKLRAFELTPQDWRSVLYLDADTEVVAPIHRFFEWVEDGWDLVITKDPHLMDTLRSFERPNNKPDLLDTEKSVGTRDCLSLNGGVWAFARNERVEGFFKRWQVEWEKHAQRDQGALLRALYADPVRVLVLGNQWNTFPKYTKGITTAGLMHYPGEARRWKGYLPGRIDSDGAWAKVDEFLSQRGMHGRGARSQSRRGK